jgi:hypothetical protein
MGGANHEQYCGTFILPTFNNAIAIAIGPGRGMGMKSIQLIGPFFGNAANYHNGGLPPAGIGISIPGTTSRTYFEHVTVENFYTGIETGQVVSVNLSDSNTFLKCNVTNAYNGFFFNNTQSYINTLYHCAVGATICVNSTLGADIRIHGGNYSPTSGWLGVLGFSAMSAITFSDPGVLGQNVYWFDATLGSETTSGGTPASMGTGVYTAYCVLTSRHGAIPLLLYSWNGGTRVGRFYLQPDFAGCFYGALVQSAVDNTNLAANMAQATIIFAVERMTMFQGNCISVDGIHSENPDIATCVFDTFAGFGGARTSALRNSFYNSQPVLTNDYGNFAQLTTTGASGTGATATITFNPSSTAPFPIGALVIVQGVTPTGYNTPPGGAVVTASTSSSVSYANTTTGAQTVAGSAQPLSTPQFGNYLVSLTHPFIRVDQGSLYISDVLSQGGDPPAVYVNNQTTAFRFVVERCGFPMFRAYATTQHGGFILYDFAGTPIGLALSSYNGGVGETDTNFYLTKNRNVQGADVRKYSGQSAWVGVKPNVLARPAIRPDDTDTLINGPPTITGAQWTQAGGFPNNQSYQLLWGGQVYHVNHPNAESPLGPAFSGVNTPQRRRFYSIVSDHHFYTYGQTINHSSCALSYQGQSLCCYADPDTLQLLFCGLGIIIGDGSVNGSTTYIVTGIYYNLGYFTIGNSGLANGSPGLGPANMFGTKGSAFTASAISQEPFSIRKLDRADQVNYQTPLTGASVTLDGMDTDLIINPAGTIANYTVVLMPNSALYDQDKLTIRSSQTISALTITAGTGSSVVGAPATLAAGALTTAIYRKANTTWYFAH